MKTLSLFTIIVFSLLIISCDLLNNDSVKGEQSPIGEVGEKAYVKGIPGVGTVTATVTSLNDGVSTYSGQATVTNTALLNILSNVPELTVSGNTVSATGLKYRITMEGISSENDSYPGTLVKYDSKVGDKYKGASGYEREVISKSTEDDYPFGFYNIKVLEIEESPCSVPGVKSLVYYANHKFGIVGAKITLDDNTVINTGLDYSSYNQ
jgi:hypothetical protein